jgi:hypothetical protein
MEDHMSQTETVADVRTATITIRDGGWWLTVEGTDINRKLWDDDQVETGCFPGNSMGHRLIEEGFMPDRSAADPKNYDSLADKLAATTLAGWQPIDGGWTIPCRPIGRDD